MIIAIDSKNILTCIKKSGLYYFGARYYDARVGRWISTDPALQEAKYFPKPNDYDTEHDYYWYLSQDGSRKLAGLGGVFNAVNMDVYHYAGNNPVKFSDPNGKQTIDPEIFKQLIISDPLIQLIKGLFEGDEAAKYAVKTGTIEVGIKAGEGLNDIGTGLIIFGAIDGNPAIIVIGGAIDTIGDITKLSFIIAKADDTKSSKDISKAIEEGTKMVSTEILGKIGSTILNNKNIKGIYSEFLKRMFNENSEIKEIDKKAGEQILYKIIDESISFDVKKVFRKDKE